MHPQTIFTKTAKGVFEVKSNTVRLTRDLRRVFLAIDGTSPPAKLAQKARVNAETLTQALDKLTAYGYIKVFYQPAAASEAEPGPAAELALDFTSPAAIAQLNTEAEARAKAEADAITRAEAAARAAVAAKSRQEVEGRARAAAEDKAKQEAVAKSKAEEDVRSAKQASAKAVVDVNSATEAAARTAAEARMRAATEALETALAEARARAEAEAKARIVAEGKAKAEASARIEAEARAAAENEARALAAAEARARAAVEAKMRAMEQALKQAEERAKKEAEARARAEDEASTRAAMEARARAEAEARATAAEDATAQAQAMAEAASTARAEAEARARAEAAARAAAERRAREQAGGLINADADAIVMAAETARAEALAKAEQAERECAEAQANAKAEAEARVRAEAQAKAEAERRAQEEAEKLRRENELQVARAEAEARLRAEMKALEDNVRRAREEAHAHEEAERKGLEDAEARVAAARKAHAEAEARVEAERLSREAEVSKAREEADRKARAEVEALIEAERSARAVAEAEAAIALEASATAETLIREAADKQTAEAEKVHDEAQKMLDAVRLAHEQGVAKAQSETMERAQAGQEDQMRQRSGQEITALVEAELKARERAELEADIKARTEAQQRAEAMAAQRALKQDQTPAKGATVTKARQPTKWPRMVVIGVMTIMVLGVGLLHIVPLSGYIGGAEKLLSERLREPVRIGGMRFALFPAPRLRLERIAIGKLQEVKIESAIIPVSSFAILEDRKVFSEVELQSVNIDGDAIPRLDAWAQPHAGNARLQISRLKLRAVKLVLQGIELPSFEATIDLGPDGGLQQALLRDSKVSLELVPVKDQGLRAKFNAENWQSPVGLAFEFSDFSGSAVITKGQIAVSGINGRLYGGTLKGAATIKWGKGLAAEGKFNLEGVDVAQLLPAFTRDFAASGRLTLSTNFAAQGQTIDELFAAPRVAATFSLLKGTLNNIDLVRAIRSPGRIESGGNTAFNVITGEAQADANRISYRNLKLVSGAMSGTGRMDISPAGELSGQLNLVLGSPSAAVARSTLKVGGSVKNPLLGQ